MNTLPKLLKERARWYKEKTLFYCDNKTLCYRDYDQITSRIAAGLRGLGVNHGDRVAVILPNGLDIAQCYWVIWKAGARRRPRRRSALTPTSVSSVWALPACRCGVSLYAFVYENDEDVPLGEVGEIICTGPTVMKGYWMMPEATARTLRGGWLHTGDLGRMDENGYIIMVDRMKDMIVTGGFNVYPNELEEVIYTHPAVLEAAVVGVPDGTKGEILKAFVALKPGYSLTEEEFFRFCRSQLDAYKVPQQVQFLDALPKTPTGKITKVGLRQVQNK